MNMREKGKQGPAGNGGQVVKKADFSGRLLESNALQNLIVETRNDEIPLRRFFELVHAFCQERKSEHDDLLKMEAFINRAYNSFSPVRREEFFQMLYDEFAENYDIHMGVETGHYRAIRTLMYMAGGFLRAPLLDITAGTGEPLLYAIETMEAAEVMKASGYMAKKMVGLPLLSSSMDYDGPLEHLFYANEISPRMLDIAKGKIICDNVFFRKGSAFDLPKKWKRQMNTVLCAQTFHLISDDDKVRLVLSMREALAPGGIAIVMEEDPFKITSTPQIEPISMFLRAAVSKIKNIGTLIAYFENNGFTKLEDRAVQAIMDKHGEHDHVMRLHVFRRKE
jgi:SAM-dependent methyltransferase